MPAATKAAAMKAAAGPARGGTRAKNKAQEAKTPTNSVEKSLESQYRGGVAPRRTTRKMCTSARGAARR